MLQKHFFLGFLLLPILLQVVTSQTIAKQGQPSQPPKDPLTPLQHAPLTIPLQSAPAPAPALPPKPQTINKTPPSSTNEQRTVPQRTSVPAAHPPQTPAAVASSSGHTSPSGQPQPPPKQLTKPVPVKRTMNSFNGPLSYGNNNKLIQSLINQYNGQYVQKPSTVYRSPLPSSSLQSLMNSITSGFNLRPIGRRSGKGSPLDNALYSLNAIPDSTGGNVGAPGEFNINNINAINEMISTALNTMNSAGGGNPMNPAGNAGVNSGLMSTVGSFLSSNIGKPSKKLLFEFPKAIYKSIGEKISGAGEAAVSATVPLKDSFFSTIKSFYSYLKPNRAGGGAQLTESNLAAAAAAAAAGFTGQSQDSGANSNGQSSSGNGGVFNFKRRQSMESPYVYHFAAAQPQITGGNGGNQRQQGNWQQQQQQQPQQQQQWNGNFANFQKQQQPSSNSGVQNSNSQFIHQAAVEQYNRQPVQFNSQQFDPTTSAQFNQALQQALFGMSSAESQQQQQPSSKVIPYGTRMQPLESQQIPVLHQHHQHHQQHQQQPHHSSGLYARSKELFNKIARKAAPRHPQPAQPAQPQIAQFPGQFLGSPAAPNQQLSSQILTKVQSKLGTLPTAYNQQQQVQQQQQPQSSSPLGQWTQSVLLSNPPSQPGQQSQWTQNTQQQTQQQQQQQPSSITSYYTQQPISQQQQQPSNGNQQQQSFSFQSDQSQQQSQQQQLGQYIGQLAGTSSVTSSSTPSSISGVTSTSVSISKSISSSSSSSSSNQQQQPSSSQLDQSMMVEGHDQGMMSDQAADGPLYYFESGPGASGAGHQEGHSSEDQAAAAQHQPTDSN